MVCVSTVKVTVLVVRSIVHAAKIAANHVVVLHARVVMANAVLVAADAGKKINKKCIV
jgi:hypothetical protein